MPQSKRCVFCTVSELVYNFNIMKKTGKLFVVATPIGNIGDITARALEILRAVDSILCEERKVAARLLKQFEISKPLIEVNEHNEAEMVQEILVKLAQGESMALISDCGTPVFSDPGRAVLEMLYGSGFEVVPIPGASSLITAISVCPFDLRQFQFLGFLPPKTEQRKPFLQRSSNAGQALILMDTPYRLGKLLEEVAAVFGKNQNVFLAADLTLPGEKILVGPISEIQAKMRDRKAEFILIIEKNQRRKQ